MGIEVVPDVLRESPLLVTPIRLPIRTSLVPRLRRTIAPSLQHLKRHRQILHNDKARVENLHALAILADNLAPGSLLLDIPRHGDGRPRRNVPVVEEPFEGDFQVCGCDVSVERNDEVVVFEEGGEDMGTDPGVVEAVHVLCLVVLVVVAVDLCCWRVLAVFSVPVCLPPVLLVSHKAKLASATARIPLTIEIMVHNSI